MRELRPGSCSSEEVIEILGPVIQTEDIESQTAVAPKPKPPPPGHEEQPPPPRPFTTTEFYRVFCKPVEDKEEAEWQEILASKARAEAKSAKVQAWTLAKTAHGPCVDVASSRIERPPPPPRLVGAGIPTGPPPRASAAYPKHTESEKAMSSKGPNKCGRTIEYTTSGWKAVPPGGRCAACGEQSEEVCVRCEQWICRHHRVISDQYGDTWCKRCHNDRCGGDQRNTGGYQAAPLSPVESLECGWPEPIPPPPRIVANRAIDPKTLYGTGLPVQVTREQIVIHFLVFCRIRPVSSEITIMRPKQDASKTAAAMVCFDTPDDAVTALGICDNNVFHNDPSGRRLRWKHANLKKPSVPIVISSAPPSPPSAPMSPIPPEGGDVNSPEYDVFAAPQVDVFADLPDTATEILPKTRSNWISR